MKKDRCGCCWNLFEDLIEVTVGSMVRYEKSVCKKCGVLIKDNPNFMKDFNKEVKKACRKIKKVDPSMIRLVELHVLRKEYIKKGLL